MFRSRHLLIVMFAVFLAGIIAWQGFELVFGGPSQDVRVVSTQEAADIYGGVHYDFKADMYCTTACGRSFTFIPLQPVYCGGTRYAAYCRDHEDLACYVYFANRISCY